MPQSFWGGYGSAGRRHSAYGSIRNSFRFTGTAVQNTAAVCALSRAAGANGMVWGQELDLTFEEKPATAEELREVHRNKTGMLINAAAQLERWRQVRTIFSGRPLRDMPFP